MADTTRLQLPLIAAAQAQKHVTHNLALKRLDALTQASVIDRTHTAPPASPADSDCYIIAATATGAWAGKENKIAAYVDGAWTYFSPVQGWLVYDQDNDDLVTYNGSAWVSFASSLGAIQLSDEVLIAEAANGAAMRMMVKEELLATSSGTTIDSTIVIPNRAIVLGVSCRTVTTVTGATSFDCGISGEQSKFGGSLGVAAGSTNMGVIGPTAFYSDTPVRLTANGGSFSGGSVRIAIHYILNTASIS